MQEPGEARFRRYQQHVEDTGEGISIRQRHSSGHRGRTLLYFVNSLIRYLEASYHRKKVFTSHCRNACGRRTRTKLPFPQMRFSSMRKGRYLSLQGLLSFETHPDWGHYRGWQ